MTTTAAASPMQADLVEMLRATRALERALYSAMDRHMRDAPGTIGEWSAKDVLAHVAAWRGVEARRLDASAAGLPYPAEDPAPTAAEDEANASFQAARAGWAWERVDQDAEQSLDALATAIGRSSAEALCVCDGTTTGIGANAVNHALAHFSDVARLAGLVDRYEAYLDKIGAVLARRHLIPTDSGVILYNIACHQALAGNSVLAQSTLRTALTHRPDLREPALTDPDLASISDELQREAT